MSIEPLLLINGIGKLTASVVTLLLAAKLGKERRCMLKSPLYFLAAALLVMSILDFGWSAGLFSISSADSAFVSPAFNMVLMAVWFYIALMVSGHKNIYYLVPLMLMSVNTFLIFSDLQLICDIITGLVLVGVFFFMGFIDHHLIKKVSYAGMAYGLLMLGVSAGAHLKGIPHAYAPWFLPDIALLAVLILMWMKGHVCGASDRPAQHHIPVVLEVVKFGVFIVGLSVFLMLGTLGVHELGHSLAANASGCSHETKFGVGYAVTHITCDEDGGSVFITLGGLILTLMISVVMYFAGSDFARRLSFLMLAFSMLISADDFTSLGIPYSVLVIAVFASMILIGYGIMLIVREYESEYASHEKAAGASRPCR